MACSEWKSLEAIVQLDGSGGIVVAVVKHSSGYSVAKRTLG